MSWTPGAPVVTEQDRAEWAAWRAERKRDSQRRRRAKYPRIDYYPDSAVYALIRTLSGPHAGGNFSAVLDRIVTEWSEGHGMPPE